MLIVSFIGFQNDTIHVSSKNQQLDMGLRDGVELNEVNIVTRKLGTMKLRSSVMNEDMISSAELSRAACCNLGESFVTNPSVDVSYSDAATIEFNNCCRGNKLSRTYEAGRLYVVPTDKGSYINETSELYDALRKYIKSSYHYERLAGSYFSLDFWEKYCTHYYYATLAGIPI